MGCKTIVVMTGSGCISRIVQKTGLLLHGQCKKMKGCISDGTAFFTIFVSIRPTDMEDRQ